MGVKSATAIPPQKKRKTKGEKGKEGRREGGGKEGGRGTWDEVR